MLLWLEMSIQSLLDLISFYLLAQVSIKLQNVMKTVQFMFNESCAAFIAHFPHQGQEGLRCWQW